MTEEKSNAAKEVMVRLKTEITNGDDTENIELITFGTLHHKSNSTYVRYVEHMEDTGEVNTTVKYGDDDEMLIIRKGAVRMRQYFKVGMITEGSYDSIHGKLQLAIRTRKLNHTVNPDTQEEIFQASYSLYMGKENVGDYLLTLTVKEEKK